MADLSAYINFSVTLDKSGDAPVIKIRDTGTYPLDAAPDIIGIVSVMQPDGITISGSFANPDVVYEAGTLQPNTKELRLAGDGNFQKGLYVITYTIRDVENQDTIKEKSFSLKYDKPVLDISPAFDVFTPSLKVNDVTKYKTPGISTYAVSRSWSASMANLGVISGNDESFDLLLNEEYYDATYAVRLDVTITYTLLGASWVSLKDKASVSEKYSTEVPASLNELYTELTAFQTAISKDCCPENDSKKLKYAYAWASFQHLILRLSLGSKVPLRKTIDEIQETLSGIDPIYEPTNEVIQPYSLENFNGFLSTETSFSKPIEIVIGVGTNYRVSDDGRQLTVLGESGRPKLIGSNVESLFIEGAKIPFKARSGSVYAFFNPGTGVITITNGTFADGAYVSINTNAQKDFEYGSDEGPYNTVFNFAGAASANAYTVSVITNAVYAKMKFKFNFIDPTSGEPVCRMNLKFGGVTVAVVDFSTDYLGEPLSFVDPLGIEHTKTYINGTYSF